MCRLSHRNRDRDRDRQAERERERKRSESCTIAASVTRCIAERAENFTSLFSIELFRSPQVLRYPDLLCTPCALHARRGDFGARKNCLPPPPSFLSRFLFRVEDGNLDDPRSTRTEGGSSSAKLIPERRIDERGSD